MFREPLQVALVAGLEIALETFWGEDTDGVRRLRRVPKIEREDAVAEQIAYRQARLLPHLAHGCLRWRLAVFDMGARSVPKPGAEDGQPNID